MNTQLNAVIFDDKQSPIENLQRDLNKSFPFIRVTHTCTRETEFLQSLHSNPDILFLDIELGSQKTIFPLLQKIPYHKYNIIFHTGYSEYMEQAINVSCISYILKGHTRDEFRLQMQKALQKIEANRNTSMEVFLHNFREREIRKQKFSVRTEEAYIPVNYTDIEFITTKAGEKKVVTFYLSDTKQLHENKNIGEIEERFAGNTLFYRIYQSTIVSIHGIKQVKREGKTTYVHMHLANKKFHVSEDRVSGFWDWYHKHTK